MKTLGLVVLSSRPLSWINTAFPFALTYYIATHRIDAVLVVGFLFFLIPYNLLMYGINDVFDYESDVRNPRKGGVEGALLPPEMHRTMLVWSAVVPVPFLVALVAWGSVQATGVLALSLFFVVAYSAKGLRFKEIPFLDSLTSSAHFVMPAIYAWVVTGESWSWLTVALLASFGLWGMASHAFGAVQDVVADREAGVGSIATAISARGTVRLAVLLYGLAGFILVWLPWPLPLIAVVAVFYIAAVAPWWRVPDERASDANRGWRWFLLLNFVAGAVVVLVLFEWWALYA